MIEHLTLTITVSYEHEDGQRLSPEDMRTLRDDLDYAAQHLADHGLLCPDTGDIVVTEWHHTVAWR
jgi:hypothetical protein